MDQPKLTLIDQPEQTLIGHRPNNGRPTMDGDQDTAGPDNRAFNGTAAVTTPGLLPTQVFERTRWQQGYAARLQITDSIVVCVAVVLAQYVRFGPTLSPPGYLKYYVPAFSVLFAIVWLSALAGFHTRSRRIIGTGIEEYRRVVAASFWTFGAIAVVTLLLKADIARGYLAVALPGGVLGLVLSRSIWRGYLGAQARRRRISNCRLGHRRT